MRLKLAPGAYGSGVGVVGGGLALALPQAAALGWGLVSVGALIVVWGIRINDRHLWQRWWRTPKKGADGTPPRTIAAPLHYNNRTTAHYPRYDDEHRGPGVMDAYELSDCRIDLAVHSDVWPLPENLPPLMVEFSERIPEDQRADWLRRQAASEEVDQLISYAMRSGNLPIWVAPIGEPERLVAPGAMVEVDHATIVSGCYRPPNDRGWLSGRPLFVKRDDWSKFVDGVQRSKGLPPSSREK